MIVPIGMKAGDALREYERKVDADDAEVAQWKAKGAELLDQCAGRSPDDRPRDLRYQIMDWANEGPCPVLICNRRARVMGAGNRFATVAQLPDGLHEEYPWASVVRIMLHKEGDFRT